MPAQIPIRPHPELREGEVYIGNITEAGFKEFGAGRRINWKTKRLGILPFYWSGERMDYLLPPSKNLFPLFVQYREVSEDEDIFDEFAQFWALYPEKADLGELPTREDWRTASPWRDTYFFLNKDYEETSAIEFPPERETINLEWEDTIPDLLFDTLYQIAQAGVTPYLVKFEFTGDAESPSGSGELVHAGEIRYDIAISEREVTGSRQVYKTVHDITASDPGGSGRSFSARTSVGAGRGKYGHRRRILSMIPIDPVKVVREGEHRESIWQEIVAQEFHLRLTDDDEAWFGREENIIPNSTHPFFGSLPEHLSKYTVLIDAGEKGLWVFFRDEDRAWDVARHFTYDRLEKTPDDFDSSFIHKWLNEDNWGNYIENTVSKYCSDVPLNELIEIWGDQKEFDAADDDEKDEIEDRLRNRCFESDTESMSEQGIEGYFGDEWKKYAMDALGFDYDRAVSSHLDHLTLAEAFEPYSEPYNYEDMELEYPVGAIGVHIKRV